jgi:hypothetical protein
VDGFASRIRVRNGIYDEPKVRYARRRILDGYTALAEEVFMAQQGNKKSSGPATISPMERLTMRVSSMINHPIAQERREVRIHRLDTDGEREWNEIVNAISEADGIDLTHNHEDASITLRWEPSEDDEKPVQVADPFEAEEPAPF